MMVQPWRSLSSAMFPSTRAACPRPRGHIHRRRNVSGAWSIGNDYSTPHGRAHPHLDYFSTNIAFTWAVTEMVCGLNSSVGAGAAAIADIFIIGCIAIGRTFSKESTEA